MQPVWGWGRRSPRMVEAQPPPPVPNPPASSGRRCPEHWVCAGSIRWPRLCRQRAALACRVLDLREDAGSL